MPGPDELLVIDFDHVLFHDKDMAVVKANEAANRGVPVGVHTYYPDDPRLTRFLGAPQCRRGENASSRAGLAAPLAHPGARTGRIERPS